MASRRQRQHRMQRQFSSHESSLSAISSPKTHWMPSLGFSDSNISNKSSHSKAHSHHSVSWNSSTIASSRADMTDSSSESKKIRRKTVDGGEDTDTSFCAFELIRQLSFSPTRERKTKKRTNTAETEVGSSFDDSDSSDRHTIGLDLELDLDLKQVHPLRRGRSPSPLLGLKYLPE